MTHQRVQFRSSSISKYRIGLTAAALFLFTFGVFTPGSLFASRDLTAASSSGIGLAISSNPSVLPSDGGTYPALVLQFEDLTSGTPFLPANTTTILLTSSSPQTGTVPSSVTFPAGSVYVLVNFLTTTLPGSTVISAIAPGYPPATVTVTTKTVGGIPSALLVFLSPSQIPPNEKMSSNVVVQVVDSSGNPVSLGTPLAVTLSSSDSRIGSVPSSLVIPANQSFATTTFSPTYVAGQTIITASAGSFATGSAVMTTVGTIARRLVLSAAPSVGAPGETATVSVQLQDNNSQTPALAPSPVSVVFTSSNSLAVQVTDTIVTIPAGSSYATVTVQYVNPGPANLTASAQGYIKGSVAVNCITPSNTANALVEYFAPDTLLPNNTTYQNALVVQLSYYDPVKLTYTPATSFAPVTVYARSSNNATMQVDDTGPQVIQPGQFHTAFDVNSTFLPGNAEITAQSQGLYSYTLGLLSFGPSPNALSLQFAPTTLLTDGQQKFQTITVGLIDNTTGGPAQAPSNIVVNLASTQSSIGQVQTIVTIPAGQTYARANITTLGVSGTTLLTASTSNYTSTSGTLTLVTKAATSLGLSASPEIVLANGQHYENMIVQLQDSAGNPEKTDSPVQVQLAIQNSTVGSVLPEVVIPAGSTYAQVTMSSTLVKGSTTITAFATGFTSGQTAFTSTLLKFQVSSYASVPTIAPGGSTHVTLKVAYNSYPVSGANVQWKVTLGRLTNMVNSTNSTGFASAVFTGSTVPGSAFITMNVSKAGYASYLSTIVVTLVVPTNTKTHSSGVLGILTGKVAFMPVFALITIAVVAPVAAFLFIRRRRGAGEYQADEEE